jgi:hypothetical protein
MNRKLNAVACCLVYSLILATENLPAGDTLIMKGNKTFTGTFQAFKNDRIYFQPDNGSKLIHEQYLYMEKLIMNPPSKVSVAPKGKKIIEGMKILRYDKPNFIFDKSGEEISMPGTHIRSIEMGIDYGRTPDNMAAAANDEKEADIEGSITTNVITIVHFHSPESVASVREGNYVSALARDSRKKEKIVVIKIIIPNWECPTAKKYDITSAPQFWFYNKSGKLTKKLTDRFTEGDIDKCLLDIRNSKSVPHAD